MNKRKETDLKAEFVHTYQGHVYSIESGNVGIAKWEMFSNRFPHKVRVQIYKHR